jgi:hypothetical protein
VRVFKRTGAIAGGEISGFWGVVGGDGGGELTDERIRNPKPSGAGQGVLHVCLKSAI